MSSRIKSSNASRRKGGYGLSQVRDACLVDRADLPFGRAVPPGLRALEHAGDVLVDRVRSDEPHLGREAGLARELRLLDRSRRPERRLDRERLPALDVIEHAALALLRDGAPHVAWNGAVAAEDLRAAVVDIERVDAEGRDGEEPRLAAAWWTGDDDHARTRHRGSARFERRVRLREHVRRELA